MNPVIRSFLVLIEQKLYLYESSSKNASLNVLLVAKVLKSAKHPSWDSQSSTKVCERLVVVCFERLVLNNFEII